MRSVKDVVRLRAKAKELAGERAELETRIKVGKERLMELAGTGDLDEAAAMAGELEADINELTEKVEGLVEEVCAILPED